MPRTVDLTPPAVADSWLLRALRRREAEGTVDPEVAIAAFNSSLSN